MSHQIKKPANPPAFPRPHSVEKNPEGLNKYFDPQQGMTLRDWFAGQALAGALANHVVANGVITQVDGGQAESGNQYYASMAYELADAMLAERER